MESRVKDLPFWPALFLELRSNLLKDIKLLCIAAQAKDSVQKKRLISAKSLKNDARGRRVAQFAKAPNDPDLLSQMFSF